MVRRRLVAPAAIVALGFAVLAFVPRQVPPAASLIYAQSDKAAPHCVPIGGTVMIDLAAIGQSTTLGTETGDLRGAVAATILNVSPGANGTTVFTVQHTSRWRRETPF